MNIYNKVPTKSIIIENNLTEKRAFELEKEYIKNYRKKYKLSNICDGGEGCSGGTWGLSKEAKQNHSKSMIGNKNMLGKHHNDETKNKIRIKRLNTKASEETKMKLKMYHLGQIPWNKGKSTSEELKQKLKNSCKTKKEVFQFDINGKFLNKYDSSKEIERILKIQHSKVSRCCRNLQKTAGGYIWKYKEE